MVLTRTPAHTLEIWACSWTSAGALWAARRHVGQMTQSIESQFLIDVELTLSIFLSFGIFSTTLWIWWYDVIVASILLAHWYFRLDFEYRFSIHIQLPGMCCGIHWYTTWRRHYKHLHACLAYEDTYGQGHWAWSHVAEETGKQCDQASFVHSGRINHCPGTLHTPLIYYRWARHLVHSPSIPMDAIQVDKKYHRWQKYHMV